MEYRLEDLAEISHRRSRNMQILAAHRAGLFPREEFAADWDENSMDEILMRALELVEEVEAYSEWGIAADEKVAAEPPLY